MSRERETPPAIRIQGARRGSEALSLERIIPRLQRARRQPDGSYMACCPCHDDREPSLSLRELSDGTLLWHCHAGCSQEAVGEALRRLAGADAPPPATPTNAPRFQGCTLQQLCGTKLLNPELLRRWAVSDGRYGGVDAVRISYLSETGETLSVQWRVGLAGERFRRTGSPTLYGLWRLGEYSGANLWCVEGVSDCWTLWHAGLPCIAFPNNNPPEALLTHFWGVAQRFSNIYIIPDGDAEGQVLLQKLAQTCPPELRARVRVVPLPEGCKDVGDLWLQVQGDADAFKARLAGCLERSAPLPVQAQVAPPQAQADRREELVLTPVRLSELHNEPADVIVPNLLYSARITFLAGLPGIGKTIFGFELATALSTGEPLWGQIRVQRARTLWLDFDDSIGRLRDLILPHYGVEPEDLDVLCLPREQLFPLTWETLPAFEQLVSEARCDLVAADTGYEWLGVADGNDERESREKMELVRELVRRTGVACLLLHHPSKASLHSAITTAALAGSLRWSAKADVVAYLLPDARDGIDAVRLQVVKNREGFKWEQRFERRAYRFIPLGGEQLPATDWQIVRSLLEQQGEAQYSDLMAALEAAGRKMSERTLRAKVQRWVARGLVMQEHTGFPRRTVLRLPQVKVVLQSGSTTGGMTDLPDCDGLCRSEDSGETTSTFLRASQSGKIGREECLCPTDDGLETSTLSPSQSGTVRQDRKTRITLCLTDDEPTQSLPCADSTAPPSGDSELEAVLQEWVSDPLFSLTLEEAEQARLLWREAEQQGFPAVPLTRYSFEIPAGRAAWLKAVPEILGTPAVEACLALLRGEPQPPEPERPQLPAQPAGTVELEAQLFTLAQRLGYLPLAIDAGSFTLHIAPGEAGWQAGIPALRKEGLLPAAMQTLQARVLDGGATAPAPSATPFLRPAGSDGVW